MALERNFFAGENILEISKSLLGMKLCTNIDGVFTSGIIVETEAYKAPEDKASHAYQNKLTPRTKTMFSKPGTAYVYICYGYHHLFNIITAPEGIAHCILIRAIEPLDGMEAMLERRNYPKVRYNLTNGPGKMSKALGISKGQNGIDLTLAESIWIAEGIPQIRKSHIIEGPRVGMTSAEECAHWPWRFRIKGNKWTSKPAVVNYK